MGQRADGDPIHARLGELPDVSERDSARRFDTDFPGGISRSYLFDRPARLGRGEVVQQHHIRAVRQRLAQFVEVCYLDFNPSGPAARGLSRPKGRRHASSQTDMIFLDQDRVAQILAVILPAPDEHGVLLEGPQSRRRLSGIQDLRARARDGAHKTSRQCGDAGEPLKQVQGDALPGEQGAGAGPQPGRAFAGAQFLAVVPEDFYFRAGIQQAKDLGEQVDSGKHHRGFGEKFSAGAPRRRHDGLRGQIT
jgi:hypothetical protein